MSDVRPTGADPDDDGGGAEDDPAPEEADEEADERLNLLEAMGGGRGILDSSLPSLAFVIGFTVTGQDLRAAIWTAVAVGALLFVLRLARRETLQFAVAGFVGVAIAAFIADRTGEAEDFFLPGFFLNIGWALAYVISTLVRWPLIGVFVGPLVGEGMEWRKDRRLVRVYSLVSWVWAVMFLSRLAVQLPLYFSDSLVALGVAKTAMGFPLFLIVIWLSYLILRKEIDLQPYSLRR